MPILPTLEGLHSAESLDRSFLEAFYGRVEELLAHPEDFSGALAGRLVGLVFEEPSTRTRVSFQAAVERLGGDALVVAGAEATSRAKGESLADMARVLGSYVDLLVWRHSADGASRLVARHAGVPVVNAGDGRLGHPTQTLLDLTLLHRRLGALEGRVVGLLGDLRHGRTARSLAWGLAVERASVLLLPGAGLEWEPAFEQRLVDRFGLRVRQVVHPLIRAWTGQDEARLLAPPGIEQPALFPGACDGLERLDALYLTRLQDERGARPGRGGYPGVTAAQLRDPLLADTLLLHPLPRRDELPAELDDDPRMVAFEQAALGPTVRMAVLLSMLRPDAWPLPSLAPLPAGQPEPGLGACANPNCVVRAEGLATPWRVVGGKRRRFLCALCDTQLPVDYVGCRTTSRVHPVHSQAAQRISPENLRPFRDREEAVAAGFAWGG